MSNEETEKINFKHLAPVYLKDNKDNKVNKDNKDNKDNKEDSNTMEIYNKAFDYAFGKHEDAEKITNVALTGSYGTGKSSIIQTYLKANKETYDYIQISLAHFSTLKGNKQSDNIDNILESKIMNQVVHQIDSKKIPKSNIKVKEDKKLYKFYKFLLFMSLFYCVVYLLHHFQFIKYEYFKMLINIEGNRFIPFWQGIFLLAILILIYLCYHFYSTHQFRLSIGFNSKINAAIENKDVTSYSYFDEFLDDVVYVFDKSDKDIVVFEDLDRYEDHSIFEKLREINQLVNYRRKKRNKKKLTFLYVIRDDIFSNEHFNVNEQVNLFYNNVSQVKLLDVAIQRVKFFDFIIPTVPVININNTYGYFIKIFKEEIKKISNEDEKSAFDNILFQSSFFVSDMRLINNIYNDYCIYFKIHEKELKEELLQPSKLLSIMIYKNLEHIDFYKIQQNEGMLYDKLYNNGINNEKE